MNSSVEMEKEKLVFRGVNSKNPYSWEGLQTHGKIAYIDSGYDGIKSKEAAAWVVNNMMYKNIMEYVDLYIDMDTITLEKYSAVILPAMLDEVYLYRYKNKINAYLQNGGVVFSFLQNFTQILPNNTGYLASNASIKDRQVHFTHADSSKKIFEGVREYDINVRRGVKGFFNRGFFSLECFEEGKLPEVILRDSEGECVAYIDRTSTNGILLATASCDLFSYGLFDNTTAKRMGANLLYWLEEELRKKDYTALREKAEYKNDEIVTRSAFDYGQEIKQEGLRKAFLTGGVAFHQKFFQNKKQKYSNLFERRVYVADMQDFKFADYDLVVLASGLNIKFLIPYKEEILAYLKSGGNILSLGDSSKEYLPNIHRINYPTNFWWWTIEGADMPLYALESFDGGKSYVKQEKSTREGLFSKINVNVAKWHCHGAYLPPEKAENILVNEMDEAIIYKDTTFTGNLYIMSLDPDYHLGQGFMPTTEPFFDALMEWVEEDIVKGCRKQKVEGVDKIK